MVIISWSANPSKLLGVLKYSPHVIFASPVEELSAGYFILSYQSSCLRIFTSFIWNILAFLARPLFGRHLFKEQKI